MTDAVNLSLIRANPQLPILLDWIGSLLMLGTVWGWFYKQFSPLIKAKLLGSERHCKAIKRLIFQKYGDDIDRIPAVQRYIVHRTALGIDDSMPLFLRIWIKVKYHFRHNRSISDHQSEQCSNDKAKAYSQYISDMHEYKKLAFMAILYWTNYTFQLGMFRIVDSVTTSLFSGKIAFALFTLGLILWNLSKLLSFQGW